VPANVHQTENDLIEAAVDWLQEHVPDSWEAGISARGRTKSGAAPPPGAGPESDAQALAPIIEINARNVYATLAVEARRAFGPRDVARLLGSVGRTLRALSPHIPILVVAPWLSARTRDLLAEEAVNYLDLTGNALVRLDNPALFIQTQGASRDPSPAPRAKARVRGPKAARLIRTLIDVRPPYGVRELADAAGLAPGYISRLLDALDEDALVERSKRGRAEAVDIAGVIRRWAESYDVFGSNDAATFLAPTGSGQALPTLAEVPRTAVTGSFAAVRHAPVAAPALLTVYCDNVDAAVGALDLIPADEGANVVLLRPFDPVVWRGTDEQDGVRYVAVSQAAADCLTGNGRMPSEGEALVEWMLANEHEWRLESLAELARPE
jgi:hypothetical protein